MLFDEGSGLAGFEGLEGFTAAINGDHVIGKESLDLRVALFGSLVIVGPSLRMAEDYPIDTDFLEHGNGDFASVGTMIGGVDVLRGDDEVLGGVFLDGLQADICWGNTQIDVVGNGVIDHILGKKGELLCFGWGLVHLPVAKKKFFTHFRFS